jgi:hypothetical protein
MSRSFVGSDLIEHIVQADLFGSTIREALTGGKKIDDSAVWKRLEETSMADTIRNLGQVLTGRICMKCLTQRRL